MLLLVSELYRWQLARLDAEEGAEPRLRVLALGEEQVPALVIDDFLPPSVARMAGIAAAENNHWQVQLSHILSSFYPIP